MSLVRNNINQILIIIFLTLVVFIFNLPFKESSYIFDWDQANDYQATSSIANGKLTLIGPRVTSDHGFFLAPWHYYFLLPFYVVTNGDLFMGFWAALLVQILFVIISYFCAQAWFGQLSGFMTGLLIATSGTLVEWGFMYVPVLSLIFFFLCLKTLKNPKFLPLLFLLFGFSCTTYTVFYALIIPFTYVIFKNIRHGRKILFGIILLLLPYLPLFIFDLRHDFLNIRNIFSFFGNQQGQGSQAWYFVTVFFRALNISWVNYELPFIVSLLSLAILIYGTLILFNKQKTFVFLWLISSLIPMSFYHGNVSEYYYAPVVLLIPFFLVGISIKSGTRGKILLALVLFILISFRYNLKLKPSSGINLSDKIDVVNQLENLNIKYSISYEFPLGQDTGYSLVFNTLSKNFDKTGLSKLFTVTPSNTVLSGTKIISNSKLSVFAR